MILQEPVPTAEELKQIVKQLGSSDEATRLQARDRLQKAGPAIVEPLLAAAAVERKRSINSFRCTFCIFIFIAGYVILRAVHHKYNNSEYFELLQFGTLLMTTGWVTKQHKALVQILSELSDVRCVGALLATHQKAAADRETRACARKALLPLLPQVTAEHRATFTDAERHSLYQLVEVGDRNLSQAALKAIAIVGDGAALPYLERFQAVDPQTAEVHAQCLAELRTRLDQEAQSKTLLRAFSATTPDGATLLRGTSEPSANPDELLRATSGNRSSRPL